MRRKKKGGGGQESYWSERMFCHSSRWIHKEDKGWQTAANTPSDRSNNICPHPRHPHTDVIVVIFYSVINVQCPALSGTLFLSSRCRFYFHYKHTISSKTATVVIVAHARSHTPCKRHVSLDKDEWLIPQSLWQNTLICLEGLRSILDDITEPFSTVG